MDHTASSGYLGQMKKPLLCKDKESLESLCQYCRSLDFNRSTNEEQISKRGDWVVGIVPSIESNDCVSCEFLRDLRALGQPIALNFENEVNRPYKILGHVASRMFSIKALSEQSIIFSASPIIHDASRSSSKRPLTIDLDYTGRSFGRVFASPSNSPLREPPTTVSYEKVLEWHAYCLMHHSQQCRAPEKLQMPSFRVIDCHFRTVVPWGEIEGDVYLTLSYVWGQDSSVSINGYRLPSVLPAVIEDAVTVTLRLGYRYLWVDRYCIPQDSTARASQIERMNRIYEKSELTIINASRARSLPGVSASPRRKYPSATIRTVKLIPLLSNTVEEIRESPWSSRGWTFQEGLLSRRCLVFTDSQAYFQCRAMRCQESMSIPLDRMHTANKQRFLTRNKAIPKALLSQPANMLAHSGAVNEYAHRKLTFETDALRAFQGILQALRTHQRGKVQPIGDYFGVPLYQSELSEVDTFIFALMWDIEDDLHNSSMGTVGAQGIVNAPNIRRRHEFPSWTWLGWRLPDSVGFRFGQYPLFHLLNSNRTLAFERAKKAKTLPYVHQYGACVTIYVPTSAGYLLEWQKGKDDLIALYLEDKAISTLVIEGWTFDIEIDLKTLTDTDGRSYEVNFLCFNCFKIRQRDLCLLYIAALSSGTIFRQNGETVAFKLLVLSSWRGRELVRDLGLYGSLTALVISANAHHSTFERVGLLNLHFTAMSHPYVWNDVQRCPGPLFKPQPSKERIWLK